MKKKHLQATHHY